jgi:hypothetical protein
LLPAVAAPGAAQGSNAMAARADMVS